MAMGLYYKRGLGTAVCEERAAPALAQHAAQVGGQSQPAAVQQRAHDVQRRHDGDQLRGVEQGWRGELRQAHGACAQCGSEQQQLGGGNGDVCENDVHDAVRCGTALHDSECGGEERRERKQQRLEAGTSLEGAASSSTHSPAKAPRPLRALADSCEYNSCAEESETADEGISFIAYRQIDASLIWIDELYVACCARKLGVATWLMARVGERKRVELQVSSAEEQTARNARRAYAGMAMRTLHKRERSRVYPGGAADGFEIGFTAEWVLRANVGRFEC